MSSEEGPMSEEMRPKTVDEIELGKHVRSAADFLSAAGRARLVKRSYPYTDMSDEDYALVQQAENAAKDEELAYDIARSRWSHRDDRDYLHESWRTKLWEPLRPIEVRDNTLMRCAAALIQAQPDMAPAALATRAHDIADALMAEAERRTK